MNYFERNLEVLREHRPRLADVILSDRTDEGVVHLTASESGEARVIFTKHDGEEVRIHSAEDPVKCARDAVDVLSKTEKEGLIVILGFGLGYLSQELLKRFEKGHMMLIYEASPQLFKAALEARDLADVLTSDKTEILIGPNADDFSFLYTNHHHLVNGKMHLVKHLPSLRLNENAYERFQKRLEEEKRLSLSNVGTAVELGKSSVGAFLQNVPNILRRAGVTALKDIFKGRSAIVVAAGPSLEKNLHLLKKAKGKAVIIAVDAALPTLLPAGILPDLLVAIDPLPENVALFKDNPLLKHVPFVCLSQYTPEIVDLYPGPLFLNMAEQNLVALWLRPFWEDKGSIVCFGGSVAHLGFAAAEYLGCSSIALIGLDLSFDAKFHAGDASSLLTEMHGQLYEFRDRADKATDIFGEVRYTLPSFLSFRTSFENRIKGSDAVFVNATEGGLPLDGFTNMRLSDFIEEYCDAPGLDAGQEIARRADTEEPYKLEELIEEVRRSRDMLWDIRKTSLEILRYIRKVQALRNKRREGEEEFHRILARIEHLTTKVRHPVLNLLTAYHYQLELYLKRQTVIEIDEMEDKLERLDAQLERGLSYYGELISAIDPFVKELDRLAVNLRREKKINRILGDMTLSEAERLSTVGTVSRKAGRIALAVKYLEALRQTASERLPREDEPASGAESANPDEMLLLAELYMRQYRYYEARELLTGLSTQEWQGRTLKGEASSKISDVLKRCREKIRAWEEREAKMGDLLRAAENSYGSGLESGLFYFKVGSYERAEKAYLNAVREHSHGQLPPQLVAAFYGLAHTYLKLKENQKAVDTFASALQVDPNNPLIYKDLGLLAIDNGNTDSGEIFLTKALQLAPWSDELYTLLARLYLGMNEMKKAVALYENGIQLNPQNGKLQQELALLYQDVIVQKNQEKNEAGS